MKLLRLKRPAKEVEEDHIMYYYLHYCSHHLGLVALAGAVRPVL